MSNDENLMSHIYILATFNMIDGEVKGMAPRFWYASWEHMEEYLNFAGKPVPGKEGAVYDDPFEGICLYAVVEKVGRGPWSTNEVMGWWKASYTDNDLVHGLVVEKLAEAPFDTSGQINFTGIG